MMPQFPDIASQPPLRPPTSIPLNHPLPPLLSENTGNLPTPSSMSTGFGRYIPSFDYDLGFRQDDFLPETLYSEPYQRLLFSYLYGDHYGSASQDINMYKNQYFNEFASEIFDSNEPLNHYQFPKVYSIWPSYGVTFNRNCSEGRCGNTPNSSSSYSINYGCGNHAVSSQNSRLPNHSAELDCNHAMFSAIPAFLTERTLKLHNELDIESFWGRIIDDAFSSESDSDSSIVLSVVEEVLNENLGDFHNVMDNFGQHLSGSEAQKQPLQKSSMAIETAVNDSHSTVIHDRKLLLDELDEIIFSLKANLAQLECHLEILSEKTAAAPILDHSGESKPVIEESEALTDDDDDETEDSIHDSDKVAWTESSCNSNSDWEII